MPTLNPKITPTLYAHGPDADGIRDIIENDAWKAETTIYSDQISVQLNRDLTEVLPGVSSSIRITGFGNKYNWTLYLHGEFFNSFVWCAANGDCPHLLDAVRAAVEAQRITLSGQAPFYLHDRTKPFDRVQAMPCLTRIQAGGTMLNGKIGEDFGFADVEGGSTFWYTAQGGIRKSIAMAERDYSMAFAAVSELKDFALACVSLAEADELEGVTLSPPASVSILASMAHDETRSVIGQAHDEAVRAAVEAAA